MKKISIIVMFAVASFASNNLYGWGKKGHDFVAEVAFDYLDAKTKNVVLSYLDGMTIQEASNWMDNVRSDKSYDYLKKLHYINEDKGQNIILDESENIVWALTTTINVLKNHKSMTKDVVKMKICILFHLIGDLHQPLHVGYGDDKGGNSFQINFNGRGSNLHSFFDSGIINYKSLTLSDCLTAKKYSKSEVKAIQDINVINWANESRSYLPSMYNTSNKIDDAYVENNYPIIKEQILKAGIRLAGALQVVLK